MYGHSDHGSPERGAGRTDALRRITGILKSCHVTRTRKQLTATGYLPIAKYNRPIRGFEKNGEYLQEAYCWLSFYTAYKTSNVRTPRRKDILRKSTMTCIEQKTEKNRLIKFSRDVQEKNRFLYEILGQSTPEQYVFPDPRTGKPYSLEYINRLLEVFKVGYGLPIRAFSIHTFRKTFGRYVYELIGRSTEGLILLNQIFRHSNLETTRRCIGLAQENIDRVFDSIRL